MNRMKNEIDTLRSQLHREWVSRHGNRYLMIFCLVSIILYGFYFKIPIFIVLYTTYVYSFAQVVYYLCMLCSDTDI